MNSNLFSTNFWGGVNGFLFLWENSKLHARVANDFAEFLRDVYSAEDAYCKSIVKAMKRLSSSPGGSIHPTWAIVQQFVDEIQLTHYDRWRCLLNLSVEVQKYSSDCQKRQKSIKDKENSTSDELNAFLIAETQLNKVKDTCLQRVSLFEHCVANAQASPAERVKVRKKLSKSVDEHNILVQPYNTSRLRAINKTRESLCRFQELEIEHLNQMRGFIYEFAQSYAASRDSIGLAITNFETGLTPVDVLLHKFVIDFGTGTTEPVVADHLQLQGCNLVTSSNTKVLDLVDFDGSQTTSENIPGITNGISDSPFGNFSYAHAVLPPSRSATHHKQRSSHLMEKNLTSGITISSTSMNTAVETQKPSLKSSFSLSAFSLVTRKFAGEKDKHRKVKPNVTDHATDEEGYTIRPDDSHDSDHMSDQSGFSSDSDDETEGRVFKGIKVEIKPLELDAVKPLPTSDNLFHLTLEPTIKPITSPAPPTSSRTERRESGLPSEQSYIFPPKQSQRVSFHSPQNSIGSNLSPERISGNMDTPNEQSDKLKDDNLNGKVLFTPLSLMKTVGDNLSSLTPQRTDPGTRLSPPNPHSSAPVAAALTETWRVHFMSGFNAKPSGTPSGELMMQKSSGSLTLAFPQAWAQWAIKQPLLNSLMLKLSCSARVQNVVSKHEGILINRSVSGSSNAYMVMISGQDLKLLLNPIIPDGSHMKLDILTYTVDLNANEQVPYPSLNPVVLMRSYWNCQPSNTDLRLDYTTCWPKCSSSSNLGPGELRISVSPGDEVTGMQSVPSGNWSANTHQASWQFNLFTPDGQGSLDGTVRAKFSVNNVSSKPVPVAFQFWREGCLLSGIELTMDSVDYHLIMCKHRLIGDHCICDP